MGKAKFVIIAAIVLLVQTVNGQSIVKINDQIQIKNAVAADDCDWPMFGRTPDGNRVVPDGCGYNGTTPKKLWEFKTSIYFNIAPVINKKKIFFGDWNNKFYCLNETNGELLWTFNVDGHVNKPACVYEGKVYFGSWDKNMYCLDVSTGRELWSFKTENQINSSPLVNNGFVYFGAGYGDNRVYCLDAKTGQEKWEYKTKNSIDCSPVLYKNNIYIASNDGNLYCLDAISGKEQWIFKTGDVIKESLTIAGGFVYLGSSDKKFYCLNPDNGSVVWVYSPGDAVFFSSVIWKNRVYFSCFNNNIFCLNAKTGEQIWVQKLKNGFDGTTTISDGKLYLGSGYEYKLICIDANNGKRIWDYDCHNIESSPVICNGRIYITLTSGYLVCLGNENDYIAWPTKIDISPKLVKIDLCQSVNLSAKVFDQNNNEIKDAKVEWSVEPKDIGTIDNTGIFKPAKTGVAKITCKCGDAVASVEINVVEFLSTSVKNLVLSNMKPYQVYKTTLTYTNNSDSKLNVKLTPSTELIKLDPSEFSIDAGKSMDVLVSCSLKEFVPSAVTNFTIDADYGGCPKSTPGTIINVDKYDCLTVTPDRLDFELVKRGNSKTISLVLESNAKQNLTITCDNPWVEISKKTVAMDVGQKETVDFKIMASSLPPSTKLTATVKITSDKDFCDSFYIPLTVMTEDSITIKLQVNSRNATINDQERTLDVPAQIVAGRTMVPLRFISESFGCSIQWDAVAQKISIIRYDITVNLWIGKDYVEVNGNRLKIDSPPVIIGDRTMVPLRFIAEPFGADVRWDAQTKGITIIWPKP